MIYSRLLFNKIGKIVIKAIRKELPKINGVMRWLYGDTVKKIDPKLFDYKIERNLLYLIFEADIIENEMVESRVKKSKEMSTDIIIPTKDGMLKIMPISLVGKGWLHPFIVKYDLVHKALDRAASEIADLLIQQTIKQK